MLNHFRCCGAASIMKNANRPDRPDAEPHGRVRAQRSEVWYEQTGHPSRSELPVPACLPM